MTSAPFFARDGGVFASSQWGGLYLTPGDVGRMVEAWSEHPADRPLTNRAVCDDLLPWLLKARDEAAEQLELDLAA